MKDYEVENALARDAIERREAQEALPDPRPECEHYWSRPRTWDYDFCGRCGAARGDDGTIHVKGAARGVRLGAPSEPSAAAIEAAVVTWTQVIDHGRDSLKSAMGLVLDAAYRTQFGSGRTPGDAP